MPVLPAEDQFTANCALLAARMGDAWPTMHQQLMAAPLINIQLGPTASGALYGQVYSPDTQQWAGLCDQADPVAQAEREVEALYSPDARVWCLIGLGLGYVAAALAKRLKPYQRLCIWEADPVLWKATLHAVDIAPLIRPDRRIDFHVGNDIAAQVEPWWLSLETFDKFELRFPLRASYTMIVQKALYDTVTNKTVDMLRMHAVGLATWNQFGKQIGDNDLLNLPEYLLSPGYDRLAGLWKDRPAVCLAAGPSLHKNLLQLLPYRDRVAVISAGTVYALAQGLHLAPDIVTTIDFQRLNYTDQFQHIPLDPACTLVYLHSTYPQTPRRWPGPRFVAENSSGTLHWAHQYAEIKGSAAIVQTVAHLNLLVALQLGANPIILLGQDLSMPPTQHHAVGARAQDEAPSQVPADAFVMVEDLHGQPVHTRHSFLSMKTVFERIIAEHPGQTIYQCSEAGLALAGTQVQPLQMVLQHLPPAPQDTPLKERLADVARTYTPTMQEPLLSDLETLSEHVEVFAAAMRDIQRDWMALQAAPDDEAAALLRSTLLARGAILQTYPRVLDLFTLRQFQLVVLLSAVPPAEGTDAATLDRLNCERLGKLADLVLGETKNVTRLLRRTIMRLRLVLAVHGERERVTPTPRELLIAQLYGLVQRFAREKLPSEDAILLFDLAANTQQYDAALSLAQSLPVSPRRVAHLQAALARYAADMRRALPAYSASSVPSAPPAEPQCGFAIGA